MAEFDANIAPEHTRMTNMENAIHELINEVRYIRAMQDQNQPPSPPSPGSPPPPPPPVLLLNRPNLNLPTPPVFSGNPSELATFKSKLFQFLIGNHNTYTDSASQLLYTGGLLSGSAYQWYQSLIDPATNQLPPSYTLEILFQEMAEFFGGGITLQTRERSLDILRQTGTVSELAIAFQNITSSFTPRWPDHPLIYVFSKKLRETIRFELTARGPLPTTFPTFLAAAIAVEQNQAAAALSRSQPPPPPPPRLPYTPRPVIPPTSAPPPRPPPPSSLPTPMDLDGSRGFRGSLTNEERRRRSEAGLCAYCGHPGHDLATCPGAARARQARGTYLGFPGPHTSFSTPLAPSAPPIQQKNDLPSQ